MNSDLTQTDDVVSTDNPQGVASPSQGSSKSSDFQHAAGTEVLNQPQGSLSVENNGQRITPVNSNAGGTTSTYLIIFVGAVVFFIVCKRLYAWVQAAPAVSKVPSPVIAPVSSSPPPVVKKPKKQPRSKRRKAK
jgi:hypothetical protein